LDIETSLEENTILLKKQENIPIYNGLFSLTAKEKKPALSA